MRWRTVKEALYHVFIRLYPNKDFSWIYNSQIEYIPEGFRVILDPNSGYSFNGTLTRDFRIVDFKDKDLNQFIHEHVLQQSKDTVKRGLTVGEYITEYNNNPMIFDVVGINDAVDNTDSNTITAFINKRTDTLAYGLFSNPANGYQTFTVYYVPNDKVNIINNLNGDNAANILKRLNPITPLDYLEPIPEI